MEWLTNPSNWIGLLTLTALEIVLGIDNIIFISILAGKLPKEQQNRGRQVGLGLALITRILLLLSLSWLAGLTAPLFHLPLPFLEEEVRAISGRDLVLLIGGLFLIGKSTHEIHDRLEGPEEHSVSRKAASFVSVIIQIMLLDIVFSIDSVITAVGMVNDVGIMIAAVVIAVIIMLFLSGPISNFVNRHPTIKMLALSFLLLIGMSLLGEGLDQHIPKGYIYFAMGFSVFVEMLNLRADKDRAEPVHLHEIYDDGIDNDSSAQPVVPTTSIGDLPSATTSETPATVVTEATPATPGSKVSGS